jgi:hypothetical protein
MMGVHGNGLTALLWMNPTPRATIIEFFYPGGFAMDYEWTTRALGMIHYGFWGSEYVSSCIFRQWIRILKTGCVACSQAQSCHLVSRINSF